MRRLVLASASPRRQALAALLGQPWRSAPADVDELSLLLDDPLVGALNVAVAKARATPLDDDELVVAADTVVVGDGRQILNKPAEANEARAMLRQLRGKAHQVLTGVALCDANHLRWGGVVTTRVVMREYSDIEIEAYIERGEPFDKAGGYAVQDETLHPVARLEGCYLNVVGFPLCAVASGLAAMGEDVRCASAPPCMYCKAGEALVTIRQDAGRSGY